MNYLLKFKKTNLFYLALFFMSSSTTAENLINNRFPLPPRLSISGSAGTSTFGEGDVMIPVWGNPNQIIYGDVTAKYGDDSAWLASAGLGARKIVRDNTILGAYFFTDYNKTPNTNYFTVLNPGIEFMTNQWDGHLNGYVPVGQKSVSMNTFTANQLGMTNMGFFRGHTQYDTLFALIENVGPGVDLEVGHTFNSSYLKRTRVFAGGYYFNPKYTANVNGVEAGFEMPLKYEWASVELRGSHDNVNQNMLLLTLRFTLDGLNRSKAPDIHDRMLDRIPRHLGNLYNGDGIPSEKKIINTGRAAVVRDNIWFFYADGTPSIVQGLQSCTFEHPCIGLAQTQIDSINSLAPMANFYLSSGTYNNPDVGSGFNFYNGQNIFGRTVGFTQLATGNDRPLVNDTIILNGRNNISNLRVNGNSIETIETGGAPVTLKVGILAAPSSIGNINIYNSDINQTSTTNNVIGVANTSNQGSFNIYNTNITTDVTNVAGGLAVGLGNFRTGGLNIYNSSIAVSNTEVVSNFNLAFGLVNNEAGLVTVSNTSIIANMANGGVVGGILNNSSVGGGLGAVTIKGAAITVNCDNSSIAVGILNQANNVQGDSANVGISQSTISVTLNNNPGASASGVLTSGNGTVSIDNSAINGAANDGSISGIVVDGPTATANFHNTIISLNASGGAVATPTQNAGTLNDNGGNQCFVNGVSGPC